MIAGMNKNHGMVFIAFYQYKEFLLAIQIRWKISLAVMALLALRSLQYFAHATTTQLSWHLQNFVAIAMSELMWEQNEILVAFKLRWRTY